MNVKVLGRTDLKELLEMNDVIEGVKSAYRLKAEGETVVWPLVSHDFTDRNAVMDIRSGGIFGEEQLHGLKMLNNFPLNLQKGLPSFNGMLLIFDSQTGIPLGVMDASYITCMRTGAAGAIGAQLLARKDSENLFILGAGKQAIFQIAAALTAFSGLKKVYIADQLCPDNAANLAETCGKKLWEDFHLDSGSVVFEGVKDIASAVADSDIIITVTPARSPVIQKEWVREGTHFSCIGADMEGKEEIDLHIFENARIFADDIPQCMKVGEMEVPIKTGVISEEDIAGEIGQVLSGNLRGRTDDKQITIFDATGLAILDLVTGKRAIAQADSKGTGLTADI